VNTAAILDVSMTIALSMLSIAFLLTVYRVMAGPTLPDRVLALDTLVAVAIGFIAINGIQTGFELYIDIAIALGLVGFLATVAFARYILVSARHDKARRDGAKKGLRRTDVPFQSGAAAEKGKAP
jgi:multicomponent Na+:H+ antiporter subunit F